MLTPEQADALVEEGTKRIDDSGAYPGWVDKIDLDVLDMNEFYDCIAGQLSNCGYGFGILIGSFMSNIGLDCNTESAFWLKYETGNYMCYDVLTEAWKKYIISRREK
jgi:hypothetical protein